MKFKIKREDLLKPLQIVLGAVERKQTLPILSNILLSTKTHFLVLAATDMEVEMQAKVTLTEPAEPGEITIPARKMMDICRTLSAENHLEFSISQHQLLLKSGRSRFSLSTLPASEFPKVEEIPGDIEFNIKNKELRYLLESVNFAVAQQDVRNYLNGMLLEINTNTLKTVATDGHRLALSVISAEQEFHKKGQFIIPRKGITEMLRLLEDPEKTSTLTLTQNHLKMVVDQYTFTSKFIDARFPDYERVIPKNVDKEITLERDVLKDALTRVSVLSNEKYRGIRLQFRADLFVISANNPENEEAEEEIPVSYSGEEFDIGFNVSYLLEALAALPEGKVKLSLMGVGGSLLIESLTDPNNIHVVMPMRL
ncbi:MAG: DNA polymerase III subunit beta [Proteobacteria bacterium]|nr:DNA polymerase III subunit beta [Pseudomonadota bacterium]